MDKKLYRDEYHKVLGGVCSGLAEYFEMDVTVVRLLFVFTVIIMGVGIIPYIVLWIVLPKKGYVFNNFNNPTVDYTVPPQRPGEQPNTPPSEPGNPFGGNPFGGNPFGANPFGENPFADNTMKNTPPKQKSNAGIIVGAVLIMLGAAILIDEFDIIPDFDFGRLWPVILVVTGAILIFGGQKKKPQVADWTQTDKTDEPQKENEAAKEDPSL